MYGDSIPTNAFYLYYGSPRKFSKDFKCLVKNPSLVICVLKVRVLVVALARTRSIARTTSTAIQVLLQVLVAGQI